MHFQYQYTPSDLKAIRDAQDRIYYSPGTTISVWALGLAICLLVLAAVGSWSVLSGMGTFAAIFVVFYVYVLTRKSVGNRESLVRKLALDERGVIESYLNSEFHRTWSSFQKANEADDHFLLSHYETVLAIPKRVVPIDQLDALRRLIARHVDGADSPRELTEYRDWFADDSNYPIYRFSWTDDDIQHIYESQLREFVRTKSIPVQAAPQRSRWLTLVVIFLLAFLGSFMAFYFAGEFAHTPAAQVWTKIVFVPVALACPFVLGYLWWKFTVKKTRETPFKIPRDEISVRLTDSHLLIGFPEAVSRYGWQDIKSFVYNEHFIGFCPKNGLIHVISNRAFGGCNQALEFLRKADELRESLSENAIPVSNVEGVESFNPYQPPSDSEY